MDELFENIQKRIRNAIDLEPIELSDDLKQISLPLRLLNMRCYNWKAEKVRKIYFVRIKVAIPSFDIFGMALYPASPLDLPGFVCDFSCTKKKVFTYINFIPLFDTPSYHERYIAPMKKVYDKYCNYPKQKIRDWMKPYVSPYTIYTFPEKSLLNELKQCAGEYLALYLDLFEKAEMMEDETYLAEVERARKKYKDDLATHDASRRMLGKIIGQEKADRFFHEVVI